MQRDTPNVRRIPEGLGSDGRVNERDEALANFRAGRKPPPAQDGGIYGPDPDEYTEQDLTGEYVMTIDRIS